MLVAPRYDEPSERDAAAVVKGVAQGEEDIFPDPMSASLYQAWRKDHKAVEKQFAAM